MEGAQLDLAALRREVDELRAGLKNSLLIGTAVGILMAEYQADRQQSFGWLVKISQNSNVKLVQVAQRIVTEAENRSPHEREPDGLPLGQFSCASQTSGPGGEPPGPAAQTQSR